MTDNETIADIIAEMRKIADNPECVAPTGLRFTADRLEAAWKREKTAIEADALAVGALVEASRKCEKSTAKKSLAVGDAAKLREALKRCREIVLQWQADEAAGVAGTTDKPEARSASEALIEIELVAEAALAAPPRNCDVGTAEEQERRFEHYCHSHRYSEVCCKRCPVVDAKSSCEFAWAQMPYEKGGAK